MRFKWNLGWPRGTISMQFQTLKNVQPLQVFLYLVLSVAVVAVVA